MAEEIKQEQKNPEQKSSSNGIIKIAIVFFILFVMLYGIKKYYDNECRGYRPYWYNPYYCTETQDWYRGSQDSNTGMGFKSTADLTQINGNPSNGIEVTAVYEKEKSQNQIFFKLYFNTHSADYSDYDFQENIVIKDSQNKEYKAASVVKEGVGHHQSTEIIFPLIASPFKLIVKNLADVPERIFNW